MMLDVTVLKSPTLSPQSNRTPFADNESNSNVSVSSLSEYRDNGNESDSNEESSHESFEDTEVVGDKLY